MNKEKILFSDLIVDWFESVGYPIQYVDEEGFIYVPINNNENYLDIIRTYPNTDMTISKNKYFRPFINCTTDEFFKNHGGRYIKTKNGFVKIPKDILEMEIENGARRF